MKDWYRRYCGKRPTAILHTRDEIIHNIRHSFDAHYRLSSSFVFTYMAEALTVQPDVFYSVSSRGWDYNEETRWLRRALEMLVDEEDKPVNLDDYL